MVLRRPRGFRVSLENYRALYREKVLRAVRTSLEYGEDPVEVVDTFLLAGPRVLYMVGKKPSPELLWDALQELDGWSSPMWAMVRYLGKKGSLDEVKEALWGNYPESPYPVREKEALEEQENLTLSELLENVMLS